MKKIYIQPIMTTVIVNHQRPLATSNELAGTGIDINKSTMEYGNGDDAAVKGTSYSVWDDDWSK